MDQTELTRVVATTYFDAWRTRDFDRLRTVLAPDVEFVGAMGTADGIDECVAGLRGMAESIRPTWCCTPGSSTVRTP